MYLALHPAQSLNRWKVGQLSPGCTVEFRRVSWAVSTRLTARNVSWLSQISKEETQTSNLLLAAEIADTPQDPKLFVVPASETRPLVVLRQVSPSLIPFWLESEIISQAGDSAILIEYGEMSVNFHLRARIHALETILKKREISGILAFCPCVRSTMV
jgi:urea carboxylase